MFPGPLPKRPYCTNELETGLRIRPAEQALNYKYIQINPPALRVYLIYDVDYPGGGLAWEDAGLPKPAWSSINPENDHAHISYQLSVSVCLTENARRKPIEYAEAIERAMTHALQADVCYAGTITKNPVNNHWRTQWGYKYAWELGELAEYLPRLSGRKSARKFELTGIGRNVDTFDYIRQEIAYRQVLAFKTNGGSYQQWIDHLYQAAASYQDRFAVALPVSELWSTAKSIGKWTWTRFSPAGLSAIQAVRGKLSGQKRGEQNKLRNEIIRDEWEKTGHSFSRLGREFDMPKSTIAWICKKTV